LLGFAVLGLADATYLTVEHYRNVIPVCVIAKGCDTVLTSSYATVFGVPTAAFGIVFYLAMTVSAIAYIDKPSPRIRYALLVLASSALLVSAGLLYIQLEVLRAICIYCMTSIGSTTALWLLSVAFFRLEPRLSGHLGGESPARR